MESTAVQHLPSKPNLNRLVVHYIQSILIILAVVCLFHCGNATSIFDHQDPVNYNGSLKTAPQTQANLQLSLQSGSVEGLIVENGTQIVTSMKITNNSNVAVNESFYLSAFLTPENATDRYWVQSWQISSLKAAESKTINSTFTVASATSVGNYRLEYIVDYSGRITEFDETDNSLGDFGVQVIERLLKPDLSGLVLNYNSFWNQLTLRVTNLGPGDIKGEIFFYRVYLSHNNTLLEAEDQLLYTGDNFTSNQFIYLATNYYFDETVNLAALNTALSGDYYLIVKVDSDSFIPETDEANNQSNYFIFNKP